MKNLIASKYFKGANLDARVARESTSLFSDQGTLWY